MGETIRVKDNEWTVTELQQGWWKAENRNQVICERSLDALMASIQASDPFNPRIDAVAFADAVPSLGFTVNI